VRRTSRARVGMHAACGHVACGHAACGHVGMWACGMWHVACGHVALYVACACALRVRLRMHVRVCARRHASIWLMREVVGCARQILRLRLGQHHPREPWSEPKEARWPIPKNWFARRSEYYATLVKNELPVHTLLRAVPPASRRSHPTLGRS
jgi:hypothetical protein